jgi:tRNA 2-thiocytidine biosynthesis protein TtcA
MLDRDEKAERTRATTFTRCSTVRPRRPSSASCASASSATRARPSIATAWSNAAPDAPREKWLVCLSGGKDSYTLLAALTELQWRGLLPVDILACNLDQGQPGFPATVLPEFLERMGVPHRIEYADTYSIVVDKVPAGADLLRALFAAEAGQPLPHRARGRLQRRGARPSPRRHPRDLLLNLFHGGRLATMPPKLLNDEGDLFVLRPLAHVAEADCARFAQAMGYPIIPCDLCGSQDGLQRQVSSGCSTIGRSGRPGGGRSCFRR